MKKLFCAAFSLFIVMAALSGCVPAAPTITPRIAVVTPSPSAIAALTPPPAPAPAPVSAAEPDSDVAFESAAEPLSEKDFVVPLAEGDFDLLAQGRGELESLTGLKFKSGELQTEQFLFTGTGKYIDSVFFFNSPTARGIKQGDSLESMLEAYGTPSEINDLGDSASYIFYVESNGLSEPESSASPMPLWHYAIGFSIVDDKVGSIFIADWTDE